MIALVVAGALGALLTATIGVSAPSEIEAKQAEAQEVLSQIQQIDAQLELAVEAYNGATVRLKALEGELQVARRHLSLARHASKVAQQTLRQRIVVLYESGGDDSAIEVILGATSLDDLLERVEATKRISTQDAQIVNEVRAARADIAKQERRIAQALAAQKAIVAERASRRDEIQRQLGEREALYASIKSEVAELEAQERARQARVNAAAEQRVAASEAAGTGGGATSARADVSAGGIAAAPSSPYSGVVAIAMQYLGVPYVWGGASPSGFDCSGFVMYVFARVGVSLPHSTGAQYGYGVAVSRDALQPGDLVFFNGLGHVGIYIGGGEFVHAPHTGDVVKVSSIYDSWYAATWVGARRIL